MSKLSGIEANLRGEELKPIREQVLLVAKEHPDWPVKKYMELFPIARTTLRRWLQIFSQNIPKGEKKPSPELQWVIENANQILSFFLDGNSMAGTMRHFGLNTWSLSVAFHISGRDDLVFPSIRKLICDKYPTKEAQESLESLATPELLTRILIPKKPIGDNFHANLIAFFKEVEENDKKIIELQAQVNKLTDERNNYKAQVVELRKIAVQMKEIMARGD